MKNIEFLNKKIIVAGSDGLLGKVLVEYFSDSGADVVSLDIKNGIDLSKEEVVCNVMSENKGAEVLVNAFALNPQPDESGYNLFSMPLSSLQEYLQVNLLSLFSVCREYARHAPDGSSIVNFSSIYGIRSPKHFIYPDGYEKHIGYSITKSGVIGLSQYLSTYLAPRIRVNTIVPGGVFNGQSDEFVRKFSSMTPMMRMMRKEEIIGAVRYFSSSESLYTTGAVLNVDGGWSVW